MGITAFIESLIVAADEAVAKHGSEDASQYLIGAVDALPLNIRTTVLAGILACLAEERAVHAKTTSNFEEFAEGSLAERTRAYADFGAQITTLTQERDRARQAFNELLYGSSAERYRLAWTSARQRAANHLAALAEANRERDALRAAFDAAESARDLAESAHAGASRRITELSAELVLENKAARQSAEACDALDRALEVERGVSRAAIAERDEARAEVVRLGKKVEALIERNRQIQRAREFDAGRANEAAQLSAEARDQADDLRAEIEQLRERAANVQHDRDMHDAWAVNVLHENGIEPPPGEEFGAIVRYIRDLRGAIATYRQLADSAVKARDEYAFEAERLGAQCQHLVNRANEFRAARDHLLKAGRDWLDAGYPTVGEPAMAGDRMASAIEDVIANVPEGQSMWALTDIQADALRALLSLVHYDELAQSWLAMLPAEVHPNHRPDGA